MSNFRGKPGRFQVPALIRRLLLSWLVAVTAEYLLLPAGLKSLQGLEGLAAAAPLRVVLVGTACFTALSILHMPKVERWAMVGVYALLAAVGLWKNFSVAFLAVNLLVIAILVVYAIWNWQAAPAAHVQPSDKMKGLWLGITVISGVAFFLLVAIWTVCRVLSFSTPTFDFGIFAQMFHSMKTTGLPVTTVERDGALSHFNVHMSPIYYVLLPVYFLFPYPATLQILQAAVMASAVIPLWMIGRQHGLSPAGRCLACLLLLLCPAFAGGASYDIHENAFLTPLILWLFYALDKKSLLLTPIFALLVLWVKEDAAVYVAVIALYVCVKGLLRKNRWEVLTGIAMAVGAILWFLVVTGYLARIGDGVMTYRYDNFMYDGSGSLTSVIKAVLLNPLKALYECVDKEKLSYIALTMLPLVGLPLLTRRYERLLLLIPYVLINLMSDYQYQHSIMFQYNFGSLACLIYMTVLNLADIRPPVGKAAVLLAALAVSGACFSREILPVASSYPERYTQYKALYSQQAETLALIPEDASVSATTFYTTQLSSRAVLYDIQYASWEHILSTNYIALDCNYDRAYREYGGFDGLCHRLEAEGYETYAQLEGRMLILVRQ